MSDPDPAGSQPASQPDPAVPLNVVLYHEAMPVARCHARVGMEGAFVRTGPCAFSRGTELEVELVVPAPNGMATCRVPAQVRRNGHDGVLVVFQALGPRCARLLGSLLTGEFWARS